MRATEISGGTDKSQSITINTEMTSAVTAHKEEQSSVILQICMEDGNDSTAGWKLV